MKYVWVLRRTIGPGGTDAGLREFVSRNGKPTCSRALAAEWMKRPSVKEQEKHPGFEPVEVEAWK